MASLSRSSNGDFVSRKGIPKDVREAYTRLYPSSDKAALRVTKAVRASFITILYAMHSVSNEPVGWKLLRLDEATGAIVTHQKSLAPRPEYKAGDPVMKVITCQL
jgi:hypothetical protein